MCLRAGSPLGRAPTAPTARPALVADAAPDSSFVQRPWRWPGMLVDVGGAAPDSSAAAAAAPGRAARATELNPA